MFQENVFCFTPKGSVIKLPKDATPIDFAYAVHTKIGNTAIIGPNKRPIEIQIRTKPMHEFAERGIASHWKYKSSEKFNSLSWKEYDWLKAVSYTHLTLPTILLV